MLQDVEELFEENKDCAGMNDPDEGTADTGVELIEDNDKTMEEEIKPMPMRKASRKIEDIPALRKAQPSYFEKFIKGVVNIPIPLFTKPYRLVLKQISRYIPN